MNIFVRIILKVISILHSFLKKNMIMMAQLGIYIYLLLILYLKSICPGSLKTEIKSYEYSRSHSDFYPFEYKFKGDTSSDDSNTETCNNFIDYKIYLLFFSWIERISIIL